MDIPQIQSRALQGYDTWIRALEDGKADGHGMAYNTAVWTECRGYAVLFLQEAKERLGGRSAALFDQALDQYQVVFENLQAVAELFPFHGMEPGHTKDQVRIRTAVDSLRTARDAEAGGLEALQTIASEL